MLQETTLDHRRYRYYRIEKKLEALEDSKTSIQSTKVANLAKFLQQIRKIALMQL